MGIYIISEKLLNILEVLSNENKEYIELLKLAKELNILHYNKFYESYIEKIRVAVGYVTSIYDNVDKYKPEEILKSKLWKKISNLYGTLDTVGRLSNFYDKEYVEDSTNNIKDILPISDSLLHREYGKKQFLIDKYILPSSTSINILIQVGMFGIEQKIKDENIKKDRYKTIELETIFQIPSNEEYQNIFINDTLVQNINRQDLVWKYIDYIINGKNSPFLDKYDAIVIAKYLWNGNKSSAETKINKVISNIKKNICGLKYHQAQLIKVLMYLEEDDFQKATKLSKEILEESETEYIKNMASSYLFFLGDKDYDYKNRKDPEIIENMPKYEPETTDDIFADFINIYSGSVSITKSDYRHRMTYKNIESWIKTYIGYISIGAFEKLYEHFFDLLKIEILQFGIHNSQSSIILEIFFNLLSREYHPTNELKKIVPIIENLNFDLDKKLVDRYVNKIINLKIINSLQAELLYKLIYILDKKQKQDLLKKIKSILNSLDDIYKRELRRHSFNRFLVVSHIHLYLKLLREKELEIKWSEERKYLFDIINKYLSKSEYTEQIEDQLFYTFKYYKNDLTEKDFELFEQFLLSFYSLQPKNKDDKLIENKVAWKLFFLSIYLKKELPSKYLQKVDKICYLYFDDDINKLDEEKLVCIYTCLKKKIESKDISDNEYLVTHSFYMFLIKTKSTEYYNDAIKLWNSFLEIFFHSNITRNIDNFLYILRCMLGDFTKNNNKIDILEITEKNMIEKYIFPCNWEERISIESAFIEFSGYTDRAYRSLIDIIGLCSILVKYKYEKEEISIADINRVLSITWHQLTIHKSGFLLNYLYTSLNEKYRDLLKITHINWIANYPLNISIPLAEVYKEIFYDDIKSINLIKELYPDIHKKILYTLDM